MSGKRDFARFLAKQDRGVMRRRRSLWWPGRREKAVVLDNREPLSEEQGLALATAERAPSTRSCDRTRPGTPSALTNGFPPDVAPQIAGML
jgi:hypothetical protein